MYTPPPYPDTTSGVFTGLLLVSISVQEYALPHLYLPQRAPSYTYKVVLSTLQEDPSPPKVLLDI